ncbi:hypothetical protein T12_10025 [Trichinella patagoniensis]|uniref:Uncharacterized protein n=1 Tax=Trichinella patagoniensis TaxID=990121 RepID=A0A0V1A8H0_9BILA|nr:hypothetical protein T12_10025 [Trichinella patagoniensis]
MEMHLLNYNKKESNLSSAILMKHLHWISACWLFTNICFQLFFLFSLTNNTEFSSAAPLSVLSQEGVRALLGRPCDPYLSFPLPVNSRQYVSCETSKASKIQKSSSRKGIWEIKQCLIGMRYDALRRCCLKNSNGNTYKTKNLKSQAQIAVNNVKTGSSSLIPCFSEKQKPCDDGVDRFTDTQQMNSSKNCPFGQFYNEGNKSCIDLGNLRYLFALVPIMPRPALYRPFIPGRNIPSYVYPPVLQNFNYFAPPFLPGPGTAPQRIPAQIILLGEIIDWPSFGGGGGDFGGYGQYGASPFSGASFPGITDFCQTMKKDYLLTKKYSKGIFFGELFPCNNAVVPYLVFSRPSAVKRCKQKVCKSLVFQLIKHHCSAKRPLSRQLAFNRSTTFGGSGAETVQVCFCWDKNTAGCFCCIGWKLLANRQPRRLLHGG